MLRNLVFAALVGWLSLVRLAAAEDLLAAKLNEFMAAPPYQQAHWGALFVDRETGETVYERDRDKLFAPASVTKCFSVAAALTELGAEQRFITPLKYTGKIAEGNLAGDLILVASGDLTLGGRTNSKGEIEFTNSDHTYANFNDDATLTPADPRAGLNELAKKVAAAGVKQASDLLVDDRLFAPTEGTGSGPSRVTPILVNDNVIDFLIEPTIPGMSARVTHRPETSLFQVETKIETGAKDARLETWIHDDGKGKLTLTGTIPAGRAPLTRIYEVPDPAGFARSLMIEALEKAGVRIVARPARLHPNPIMLPSREETAKLPVLATLESPPFAENARLILKVSHNLHASTLPLLLAAKHGQRTLAEGMQRQRDFLLQAGVPVETISFGGGAGGSRADFVTPAATVQLLRYMASRPDFAAFERGLPSLGVDGTLAKVVGAESPVREKVHAKTGTLIWENTLNGHPLLNSKALAGYLITAKGRTLVFALFVNGVQLRDGVDVKRVGRDLGKLCELVYAER